MSVFFAVHSFINYFKMYLVSQVILLSITTCVTGAAVEKRVDVPAGYVAAPYYPTPHGGWVADWTESYRKASLLVSNMTLAEKTNVTAGTGIFMGKTFIASALTAPKY
jgi:beta-glucosidase